MELREIRAAEQMEASWKAELQRLDTLVSRELLGCAEEDIGEFQAQAKFPAPMAERAFYGLAGEFVREVAPFTEADPSAVLFGSAVGRGPTIKVEADQHHTNVYICLVGSTANARKGTSWGLLSRLFEVADPEWLRACVKGGLSTGEGVLWAVRDPVFGIKRGRRELIDEGVTDKRLLVYEPEFGRVLRALQRNESTLSPLLRQAWDTGNLRILTKTTPVEATGAHISLVAHVTAEELRLHMPEVELTNGLCNRVLWVAVRRSKVIAQPQPIPAEIFERTGRAVRAALERARKISSVTFAPDAARLWERVYPELSEGTPGLLGAITARAEAQAVRLALVYALQDGAEAINAAHLAAALEVIRYVEATVKWIWREDPATENAQQILDALKSAGQDGMTRDQLYRQVFGGHITKRELNAALSRLYGAGLAYFERRATGGRPLEVWFAKTPCEKSEESEKRICVTCFERSTTCLIRRPTCARSVPTGKTHRK